MEREILFRGKLSHSNEWVEGYYVKTPIDGDRIYLQPFDGCSNNTWYYVKTETVGQYTGLKDKNGKKIFEGDRVIVLSGEEYQGYREFDKIGIIKYSGLCFDLVCDNVYYCIYNSPDFEIEIIGNIYDNK